MTDTRRAELADYGDGLPPGPDLAAWLAANPEAADEADVARRVRLLLEVMREAAVEVPEGFEQRLLARVREDRTLLDLIDFGLSGVGRTLLELLSVLFALLPQPAAGPA